MPNRHMQRRAIVLATIAASFLVASCDDEPSGPQQGYTIRVQSGDDQFAGFNQELENPLRVIVENAQTGDPVSGVAVEWSLVEGSGADLAPISSTTDASGIAATTLVLGPSDTEYSVRATVAHRVGSAATFDATAVSPAQIDSVAPGAVDAGDTIRIHGTGFAASAGDNTVLVAGFRAEVVEATPTMLRAVVPACTPTRIAEVRVNRGVVISNAEPLSVTGIDASPLTMSVGEVTYLDDAAAASCLRLAAVSGARYLVMLQNATSLSGQELPWRLTGAAVSPIAAPPRPSAWWGGESVDGTPRRTWTLQDRLDFELRDLESIAALRSGPRAAAPFAAQRADIEVGDRQDFWVFRRAGEYERITAIARHISDHAILFEDVDAPANGFGTGDFEEFGALFDDPIYESLTAVYGQPSDVDANDKVIILFTPVVNQLTPPGTGSTFVAGFFFGIDLLDDQQHGNDAEIFYTLVPDPDGEFGNVRTFDQLLQGVPPVMAHELQHMLHFNQRVLMRDASLEHTWLSEGLAHSAEELVADEFQARGDSVRARAFRLQNYLRADAWLDNPSLVSPIGPATPLPVRGASWMLIEYLRGHSGGNAFLGEITQTTASGVANLTAASGLDWGTILHRFGFAVFADDAGIPNVDPVYAFPDVNLRLVYETTGFPLLPASLAWSDFTRTGSLASAGSQYWILDVGSATAPIHLGVAGRHAPHGASDRPQLSIMRIE